MKGLCYPHYQQLREHGRIVRVEVNPYRTDNPTYGTVHSRLKRKRGIASQYPCAECGEQAKDWAFDNQEPYWINPKTECAYHDDLSRYRPLCKKCHVAESARPPLPT